LNWRKIDFGFSGELDLQRTHSEESKTSKDQSWLKRIAKESADASRNNSRQGNTLT
jgi:hypothetical protein